MGHVLVVGGGVAGLTAAHELAERGVRVTVVERTAVWGGKCRSIRKPGSGVGGRADLPGEHGVRFFPGFYRHVTDTMRRIPYPGNRRGVLDNLVTTRELLVMQEGGRPLELFVHFPRAVGDVPPFLRSLATALLVDVPLSEKVRMMARLSAVLAMSPERRLREVEDVPWERWIGGDVGSERFAKYFSRGYTHFISAADPTLASTRTFGAILGQMLRAMVEPGLSGDQVLTGPTNDVWIDPWVAHLRALGVTCRTGVEARGLRVERGRVRGVEVVAGGEPQVLEADAYVLAVPAEVMARLAGGDVRRAAPSLGSLERLHVAFMGGVQYYLDRELGIVEGHLHYADAAWKLTARSQPQFWRGFDVAQMGDGRVRDILSVSVADWGVPGTKTTRKTARDCTAKEVADEVWAQLLAHYGGAQKRAMERAQVVDWHLDARIADPATRLANQEPLFVNSTGSWWSRPEAGTELENLVVAADYVRTHTDIASMEAACEAGRRGANAVLERLGASGGRAGVWPLTEPAAFRGLQALDRVFRGAPGVASPGPAGAGRTPRPLSAEPTGV